MTGEFWIKLTGNLQFILDIMRFSEKKIEG
jgi:hypothetical protein